jgi:hypothetical protein
VDVLAEESTIPEDSTAVRHYREKTTISGLDV